MSKPTFAERCLLAEQCLPDAPYRAMLKKLHSEMLEALAEQPAAVQGWKLVPVEPTEDMWKAVNKLDDEMAAGSYDGKGCSIEQAWNCLLAAAPQPAQQEPVAWMHEWEDGERIPMLMGRDDRNQDEPKTVRPLVYGDTSPQPAQRTWVGLSDKEIADAATSHPLTWVNLNAVEHRQYFARAIEAKIKEKNA